MTLHFVMYPLTFASGISLGIVFGVKLTHSLVGDAQELYVKLQDINNILKASAEKLIAKL